MSCTVAQRHRAHDAAETLRSLGGPFEAVHVSLVAPADDPTGYWTLDVVVESPDGPGAPATVLDTLAAHGLWLHGATRQGTHAQVIACVPRDS